MPLDQANWQITLTAADKTANAFRSVQQNMQRVDAQAKATSSAMSAGYGAVTRVIGPLIAAFSAAALAQKAWSAGMKAADLGEQAEQIGLTTDQLQAYRLVAAQSGVATEQMDAAMMKLARAMGTANEGSDEMIARFDRLGVKLLDANGQLRKAGDVMPEVARGLLNISSETERSALMQELFGRSGARLATILEQVAQGNSSVVAEAQRANAVIDKETIEAWKRLSDQLKVAEAQASKTLATLGAPIATAAMEAVNKLLISINANLDRLKLEAKLGTSSAAAAGDVQILKDRLAAEENLAKINPNDKLRQASIKALRDQVAAAEAQAELQRTADAAQAMHGDVGMPPITVTGDRGGAAQPTGKKAATDAATLANKRLAESQRAMDELVRQSAKEFEDAQQIIFKYGDGAAYAADQLVKLDEASAFIKDPKILARAQKEITDSAAEMERAYRGAAGGFEGFLAGIEQGMADMANANSAFNIGKAFIDELSQAITDLAMGAEVDFGRILQSFANMLLQMQLQAAASSIFKAISGGGGGFLGGLLGGIFGGGGGISNIAGGFDLGGDILTFADGGRPPVGVPSWVGENGRELFVPDGPGTIFNREQLGGMGGGGSVIVHQTVNVGEFVTSSEYRSGLRAMEQRAKRGAMDGMVAARKRGNLKDVFS